MTHITTAQGVTKLGKNEIQAQLARCPSLPSLGSINKALQGLLLTEQRYTAQIAEIIRRDPSLTSRLLKLVNSVYFGLTTPVNSIEEAVFYLGVRQIRQLTMVTPIIEDFQRLTKQCAFPWREFWQHCIGTAILTREVTASVPGPTEDHDYVAGLIHDVGKIVMAWSFPDHFAEIHRQALTGTSGISEIEDEVLGINHSELGALYLERHRLPELMIYSARYHHNPDKAPQFRHTIAAVQLADLLLRSSKIGCSGDYVEVTRDQCYSAPVWNVLLARTPEAEQAIVKASLSRTLDQIPTMLEGMV
ncbi:MAG TPA: HDOD domain-containing protein [Verrucomicrobiae bacterium]|nr:HDOD domain-containing protein [Verrucomicrobiae bacterium]